MALPAEPEAISEADTERLAERSRELRAAGERERLEQRRARLESELAYHEAQARHRERQLRRLRAKL